VDDFRRSEASEHYERAMALERAGRITEALAEYRRAVDVDPGFAAAHEALGYHYQRRGLLTKACDAFQTVARLEDHYGAHFNLGFILVELERYEEALAAFRQCLALVPGDPAALYEMAYIYYIQGLLTEALATLQSTHEAYEHDWRAYNLEAACLLGLENWPAAEEKYRQALRLATLPTEAAEAQAGLQVALRYQEFPVDVPLGFKERAYADDGLVALGTAGDDGLEIPFRDRLPHTPAVLAVTLRRLQSVVEALDLGLTAVVAVDRASGPLAAAVSSLLTLPRKRLRDLGPQERPLLVLLAGGQPELLQVALEQAPSESRSFVFALSWYGESEVLPDIVGVPVRQTMAPAKPPSDERHVLSAGRNLLDVCAATPPDPTQEAQVRFYLEHRRLRFLVPA
jgi:Flp pilus assembly protein TadD